jgi:hypothetical protein
MTTSAQAIVAVAGAYLVVGCLVAIVFVVFGIGRIDPAARGSFVFRMLLLPGLTLLWPAVVSRWFSLASGASGPVAPARPSRIKRLHGLIWSLLAVLLPLLIALMWSLRSHEAAQTTSQRLAPPPTETGP